MKIVLLLLLILLTWYLAAMYHLVSLMVLAVAQLLLLLCMLFLSRYFKRHLSARFIGDFAVVEKQRETPCPLLIENTGRFPTGPFRLRFLLSYWNQQNQKSDFLYGDTADPGETSLVFQITAPWCGLLRVSIDSIQIFDYLSLFKAKTSGKDNLSIAVLPLGTTMKISFSHDFWHRQGWLEEVRPAFGNGSGEIRQLREYAPGDSYRLIHWNQTARMEDLWVKEQEPEQEKTILLYLDLRADNPPDFKKLDAFFEVLYSLILSLLQEGLSIQVQWKEPNSQTIDHIVSNVEDGRRMLLQLYQNNHLRDGGISSVSESENGFCLDLNLRLSANGREVFQFSQEDYKKELEHMSFIL